MNIISPLENLSRWLTFSVFKIQEGTALAGALSFFILDTLKIFILLIVVTHLMSLLRYYLPVKKFRDFLASHKLYGLDYFLSACFGALTPFCSCSSIPLFIGFLQAEIPLGVSFAFLITSPLINEIAIGLFIGLFGIKITLLYLISGIAAGVIGGFILGKLKMEKYIISLSDNKKAPCCCCGGQKPKFKHVAKYISNEAFGITKKVSLYIIIGVALGALIHGYVPSGFFENYLGQSGIWSVPVAAILAVPLYSNAAGVIPIISALIDKGVPLGTALAFMMAIVGLSLPEGLMLKRVLKMPLLLSFFGVVTVGIIIIGFLFNYFV